jgi:hypothetical protein
MMCGHHRDAASSASSEGADGASRPPEGRSNGDAGHPRLSRRPVPTAAELTAALREPFRAHALELRPHLVYHSVLSRKEAQSVMLQEGTLPLQPGLLLHWR